MRSPGLLMTVMMCAAGPAVQAAVGSNDSQRLESASMNEGGGTASSSHFKQQSTIGETVAGHRIASTNFRIAPGFLGASTASTSTTPPAELKLVVLYARTEPGGQAIPAATWQADRDPVFLWEPPPNGPDVAGYSYAIDGTPDATIDTIATSVNIATRTPAYLADGRHTFSVAAVNSGGNLGPPLAFQIWVDTAPPVVASFAPSVGAVVNTLSPQFQVEISETSSGVAADKTVLTVNSHAAGVQIDPATNRLTLSGVAPWREGVNSLSLAVADAAGNAAAPVVWSLTIDVTPPTGTVLINGGAEATAGAYVTLSLTAQDALTGVERMQISNEAAAGFVEEPFVALRELWLLTPVRGPRRVYARFIDRAGNVSETAQDEIFLDLRAPETILTDGPAGITAQSAARFAFTCSDVPCVYAWAFDGGAWSDWSEATTMSLEGLAAGNHYFRVKAAKDTNGRRGIQADEEDPAPAERTWIVSSEAPGWTVPKGPPVKLWRVE